MLSLGVVKWFLQGSCVNFCVSELHLLPFQVNSYCT